MEVAAAEEAAVGTAWGTPPVVQQEVGGQETAAQQQGRGRGAALAATLQPLYSQGKAEAELCTRHGADGQETQGGEDKESNWGPQPHRFTARRVGVLDTGR